jgi:hypothetical protein
MKLKELTEKYCFHDSLLESIEYDKLAKTATFEIDFCNWAQDGYTNDKPETMIVRLNFKEVKAINNYLIHVESSGISNCKIINIGNDVGIEFVICHDYPDGDGGVDMIQVVADSVEFIVEG